MAAGRDEPAAAALASDTNHQVAPAPTSARDRRPPTSGVGGGDGRESATATLAARTMSELSRQALAQLNNLNLNDETPWPLDGDGDRDRDMQQELDQQEAAALFSSAYSYQQASYEAQTSTAPVVHHLHEPFANYQHHFQQETFQHEHEQRAVLLYSAPGPPPPHPHHPHPHPPPPPHHHHHHQQQQQQQQQQHDNRVANYADLDETTRNRQQQQHQLLSSSLASSGSFAHQPRGELQHESQHHFGSHSIDFSRSHSYNANNQIKLEDEAEQQNEEKEQQPQQQQQQQYEVEDEDDEEELKSLADTTSADKLKVCEWYDCSNTFLDMEEFVRHLEEVHVNQEPREKNRYFCQWANCKRNWQEFNARYKLLIHMRVHSGEKPYACTTRLCKKSFSRLENLKIHMRSHTGEKPYKCNYKNCSKSFTNSSDRIKHHKTHKDPKPYNCTRDGCTKRYTDPSSLRKHLRAHKRQQTGSFQSEADVSAHASRQLASGSLATSGERATYLQRPAAYAEQPQSQSQSHDDYLLSTHQHQHNHHSHQNHHQLQQQYSYLAQEQPVTGSGGYLAADYNPLRDFDDALLGTSQATNASDASHHQQQQQQHHTQPEQQQQTATATPFASYVQPPQYEYADQEARHSYNQEPPLEQDADGGRRQLKRRHLLQVSREQIVSSPGSPAVHELLSRSWCAGSSSGRTPAADGAVGAPWQRRRPLDSKQQLSEAAWRPAERTYEGQRQATLPLVSANDANSRSSQFVSSGPGDERRQRRHAQLMRSMPSRVSGHFVHQQQQQQQQQRLWSSSSASSSTNLAHQHANTPAAAAAWQPATK